MKIPVLKINGRYQINCLEMPRRKCPRIKKPVTDKCKCQQCLFGRNFMQNEYIPQIFGFAGEEIPPTFGLDLKVYLLLFDENQVT